MNVIRLLSHKDTIAYVYDDYTLRQGLEKMRAWGYSAVPVIDREGRYVGTVSEGDFLWYIVDRVKGDTRQQGMKEQEKYKIREIIRKDFMPSVKIDVTIEELVQQSMRQNFIPVTDADGIFIGIVTRQDIIRYAINGERKR